MTRILLFGAGLLALLGALLAPPARANDAVRFAIIPIVDCLPLFVAQDRGLFEAQNLDVTLIPVANQGVVISSMVSGSAEIGNSVASTVLQAHEAGIDTVIFADGVSFPYPQPIHTGVLARAGSNIHSAKDLVGRKVAVIGLNGYHHVLVRRWLTEQGVDPASVMFLEVAFPQMPDVVRTGQVDAVVSIDPFYSRMIRAGSAYPLDNFVATVPDGALIDFYIATRDYAAAHPDVLRRLRAAMAQADIFIREHDPEAREILAKWTHQPPEVVATTSIADFKVDVAPRQIEFWIDLAHTQGLISALPDPASFIWQPPAGP
jgi:NitT/TauT family transport system substrate-binding protein